jgi:hypothetical protein
MPTNLSPPAHGWTETTVARVAGVKKSVLANVRRERLARGAAVGAGEWWLDERNQVVYARTGLVKLLTGLGLNLDAFLLQAAAETAIPLDLPKGGQQDGSKGEIGALAGTGQASAHGNLADLMVERVLGQRRVRARLPDGGIVALLVRKGENFMPGMVCKGCVRAADGVGPWSFLGTPPRRKGKW